MPVLSGRRNTEGKTNMVGLAGETSVQTCGSVQYKLSNSWKETTHGNCRFL